MFYGQCWKCGERWALGAGSACTCREEDAMSKDEIQKVTLGTNEALRVTADGEFIWHPEADAMIEDGDFTSSPAMRHILRALRKALVHRGVAWLEMEGCQMTTDRALDLALEALEHMLEDAKQERLTVEYWNECVDAITAIKLALAAPVQEPVAYWIPKAEQFFIADPSGRPFAKAWEPLYSTPPAAPDLQAELDATNRQVEILSDALAESRREVAALKAVQEPVAWLYKGDADFDGKEWRDNIRVTTSKQVADWQGKDIQPLYTTPPAAKLPWVGLTDEEMQAIWDRYAHMEMMRAIEAKLKELNT